jgi:hypothetical protein
MATPTAIPAPLRHTEKPPPRSKIMKRITVLAATTALLAFPALGTTAAFAAGADDPAGHHHHHAHHAHHARHGADDKTVGKVAGKHGADDPAGHHRHGHHHHGAHHA